MIKISFDLSVERDTLIAKWEQWCHMSLAFLLYNKDTMMHFVRGTRVICVGPKGPILL